MRLALSLTMTLLATAACASAPEPGDAGYAFNVGGSYMGRFMIDSQPFDGTLQLRTSAGGRVSGGFRVASPVEIDGRAEGVIRDDFLRLTISYPSANGCDSRIEGILTIERGGNTIDGPVTVTDCGEPIPGRMSFRRPSE